MHRAAQPPTGTEGRSGAGGPGVTAWARAATAALEPLRTGLPADAGLRSLSQRYLAVVRAEIAEVERGEGPSRDSVDEEEAILDALAAYCGGDEDIADLPMAITRRAVEVTGGTDAVGIVDRLGRQCVSR